ncbi:MAG: hypothetical protein ACK5C5_03955 [Bacteroidota bacterium]
MSLFLFLMFFVLTMGGCYYDVEEELYGVGCETSNVTYSGTVVPMLESNGCLSCHAAPATAGQGVVLDNYESILSLVQQNRFVSGADRMPSSSPVLSDCDINKLKAWADAGASNN